ncbi:MAG: DoxX family membrane protein [Candidatus Marinimicrobia bacterium]|nr:DoxX family membrane protein [Candidatus Neomarinimicrobiota bacterium]
MKKIPFLNLIFLILLSVVFLVSGFIKLRDPYVFVQDIMNYRLLPLQPLHFLAIWLIMIELFAGIGLWIPFFHRASAWIISGLMVFFIFMIAIAMARGLDISCGCFGPGSQRVGWPKIFENLGLLIATLYLLWPEKEEKITSNS